MKSLVRQAFRSGASRLRTSRMREEWVKRITASPLVRRVRRELESKLPLAAPVLTHLLDAGPVRASSNGHGRVRRIARPRKPSPLAMVLGFTLPIGNGRGSSRLHIRTLFRLER